MIVRVILVGVLGVIVDVLIGLDEVRVIYVAIFIVIFCNWRCTLFRRGTERREGVNGEEGERGLQCVCVLQWGVLQVCGVWCVVCGAGGADVRFDTCACPYAQVRCI